MAITEKLKSIRQAYKLISLEPIFLMLSLNISLIGISTYDLYLAKACKVNLNYTDTLCDHIHQHGDVQRETQKYVRNKRLMGSDDQLDDCTFSGVQAYNGLLQSAPVILFTLFAGPLTDKYGRKPLIVSSLAGYLLLNVVMLINSIWFYQLKVGRSKK